MQEEAFHQSDKVFKSMEEALQRATGTTGWELDSDITQEVAVRNLHTCTQFMNVSLLFYICMSKFSLAAHTT